MSKSTDTAARAPRKRMTREERRQQIVEVTLRLIQERGLLGATTPGIAAAAGVTEPTLYRHFGNHRGILLAALAVVFVKAREVIESSQHPNVLERLREIGESHRERLTGQKPGFADPLFEFIAAPAKLGLRDEVRSRNMVIVNRLIEIVDQGKAQGTIRADVDSPETAWQIVGVYWFEDVAYLMGVREIIQEGISSKTLDAILRDISA